MGGDWTQLIQSVFIGLVFSFLLAKLISFITALKEDNIQLPPASGTTAPCAASYRRHNQKFSPQWEGTTMHRMDSLEDMSEVCSRVSDDLSVLAEAGSAAGGDLILDDVTTLIDDEDWEGVEATELDNAFSAATAFVAAENKVPNEVQLHLYALYKIATEGPCSVPPPPAFKRSTRAKWNVWQKMGAMPPEDAMQKYIDTVTELFPSWQSSYADNTKHGDAEGRCSESKEHLGPVLSTLIHKEESRNELNMDAVHAFAKEGDVDKLLECIENGVSVNLKDSGGRGPLHWAVDRGHVGVIELLLNKNADVNAKDNEGRTPLHYAVASDRKIIAEYLVKHNADVDVKDNDGVSPSSLCDKNWPCMMQPVDQVV